MEVLKGPDYGALLNCQIIRLKALNKYDDAKPLIKKLRLLKNRTMTLPEEIFEAFQKWINEPDCTKKAELKREFEELKAKYVIDSQGKYVTDEKGNYLKKNPFLID